MMKYLIPITIIGTTLIWSCNQQKTGPKKAGIDHFQATKDSLSQELNEIMKQDLINGFGVAIVNEDGVLYENGIGWANREKQIPYTEKTVQNIASVSKTLVGISLMKAQELGKLKLDDPVNKYLGFEVKNPHFPDVPITIRHLATHTSTIKDTRHYMEQAWVLEPGQDLTKVLVDYPHQRFNTPDKKEELETFLRKILVPGDIYYLEEEGFLKNKPGELFEYSNIGTALAGLVLEKVMNKPFHQVAKEFVLDPLKMNASGWAISQIDFSQHSKLYASKDTLLPFYNCNTYPDGQLTTSSADMGKYLCELVKGFNGKGTLLSKESYQELFRQQLSEKHFTERNADHPYNDEYNTGIFMGFSAKGYVGHSGGDPGVGTWMFFDAKTKTGRYMVKNTDITDRASELQYYAVWDKMDEYVEKLDQLADKKQKIKK